MEWRLGLDMGTNSIGWVILTRQNFADKELDGWALADGGVRIFPDSREPSKGGRIGDPLALQRRLARATRRNRDRRLNRMAYLMRQLQKLGLMPNSPAECQKLASDDPYQLRAEALERPLSPFELGRALFHLAKRRGFQSNRKGASKKDAEQGLRAQQISALKEALNGKKPEDHKTLGQFLHQRRQDGHPVRFRGAEGWFPDRAIYQAEFDAIQKKQQAHHTPTNEDWLSLRDQSLLFQHPLKPVERGACSLLPGEKRAFKDSPTSQWFRLHAAISDLRLIDLATQKSSPLDSDQKDRLLALLTAQASMVTFEKMRKEKTAAGTLLFPENSRFNKEDERVKGIEPHRTAALLRKEPLLAPFWDNYKDDSADLDRIFESLHKANDDDDAMRELIEAHQLTRPQAEAFAKLPLLPGITSLSLKAMQHLLEFMRGPERADYIKAVTRMEEKLGIPRHHSYNPIDRDHNQLPYYGELLTGSVIGADAGKSATDDPEGHYGRIANPTVHVALNQLRKLVNHLIEQQGSKPCEIHIELARDLKLSNQKRAEVNKTITKNTKENKRLADLWRKITKASVHENPSRHDLRKLKLWEELGDNQLSRCCVFTGKPISGESLFVGTVEIEHLLPFSRTLDDSNANLTLAYIEANRQKGNQTPFEAFGGSTQARNGFIWSDIMARANSLPKAKVWRFGENAMEKWAAADSFLARQLTDNAYISRSARRYLGAICKDVQPAPGRLTALIRGKWRLNQLLGDHNQKNRDDHRHHMIDAFVVALADKSLLNHIARQSAKDTFDSDQSSYSPRLESHRDPASAHRLQIKLPDLPCSLRVGLQKRLEQVIISYKADHGHQGRLFKETAYGILRPQGIDPGLPDHRLVVRKPLPRLSHDELTAIRDKHWRREIEVFLYSHDYYALEKKEREKRLPAFLEAFSVHHKVKKLRILIKNQSAIPIKSAPYKAYAPDSFVCCDLWQVPKGKKGAWQKGIYEGKGCFWSYADAIHGIPAAITGRPHPAARYWGRLFKHDLVAYEEGGKTQIMRVGGFNTTTSNGRLDLRPHRLAKNGQKFISINILMQKKLRKIHLSLSGWLSDPGTHSKPTAKDGQSELKP